MKKWPELIQRARQGDIGAFDILVQDFRDMAVGYAHSILRDFSLAEDAAQEAFVQAYRDLKTLREPTAFPSWLRRIVFKYCDRISRKRVMDTLPLDGRKDSGFKEGDPQEIMQKQETQNQVLKSINELPDHERSITNLFYINGYSVSEIGDFLEVPANTVKSRLHSARKKLRKRMVNMVETTLKKHAPGKEFNQRVRKILDEVPIVSFELHQTKKKDGLSRCPESVPFPSCLRAYLEYRGEDLGYKKITFHNRDWRLDTTYVFLMGTTGSAFRQSWKKGWEYDNPLISHMSIDPLEPFQRGINSLGYQYDIILKDEKKDQESLFQNRIMKSIKDQGKPVIAQGVVGPPEECLITGFDEEGKVLLGWSFFQRVKEFNRDLEIGRGGYFRKRNWFKDTYGLIFIGEKQNPPPLDEVYLDALSWAISVMETRWEEGDRCNGFGAYKEWAEAILDDGEFTGKKVKEIRHRYHVHHDSVGTLAEGRWYAYQVLNKVMDDIQTPEDLSKAASCLDDQHSLMWQVWGLVGGPGMSDKKAKLFASSEIRKKTAELILRAMERQQEAASHIREALDKW